MANTTCPICGRAIESVSSDGEFITGFGHDLELEDLGGLFYLRHENTCLAHGKGFRVSDYTWESKKPSANLHK